ncbi:cytochrome P450-like protein [Hypoxylon sp. FL1284]|nr:cytochrome P450-like protein [Hypoxylon sp. FL1284]
MVGDRHIHFLEMHKRYGPVFRFGPNRLVVNTTEALQKIYGVKAYTRKSKWYDIFNSVFDGDDTHSTVHQSTHLKKKKVVATALSDSSLKHLEERLLRNISKFLDRVGDSDTLPSSEIGGWSSPKNMAKWSNFLTFDILGDICFSNSFQTLDTPDNRDNLEILSRGVSGLDIGGWMPAIVRLGLGDILFPGVAKGLQQYRELSEELTARRFAMNDKANRFDVLSYLIAASEEAEENASRPVFSPTDLVGEIILLITGGTDTTGSAIATTTFYLLHNEVALVRLEEEIRGKFETLEDIRSGPALNACPWLRACIDEAMRISPSVPGVLPREVLAPGVKIGDDMIPAGTDIVVCHYAIHHNEEYYPDSFSYLPQRWIAQPGSGETVENAAKRVALARSAFCPFSIGPRGCVGKGVALRSIMITVARLVWAYEMRLAPSEEERGTGGPGKGFGRHRPQEQQIKDMFTSKLDGPMVQFRKRLMA